MQALQASPRQSNSESDILEVLAHTHGGRIRWSCDFISQSDGKLRKPHKIVTWDSNGDWNRGTFTGTASVNGGLTGA